MQTWPSWDAYAAMLQRERDREAAERREVERWRTTLCAHGRNLMQRCAPCESEIGET